MQIEFSDLPLSHVFHNDINVLFFSYTFVNSHFTAEGSHLVINLRSIIAIIIQEKGSKMYTCMAGTSNLTRNNC